MVDETNRTCPHPEGTSSGTNAEEKICKSDELMDEFVSKKKNEEEERSLALERMKEERCRLLLRLDVLEELRKDAQVELSRLECAISVSERRATGSMERNRTGTSCDKKDKDVEEAKWKLVNVPKHQEKDASFSSDRVTPLDSLLRNRTRLDPFLSICQEELLHGTCLDPRCMHQHLFMTKRNETSHGKLPTKKRRIMTKKGNRFSKEKKERVHESRSMRYFRKDVYDPLAKNVT